MRLGLHGLVSSAFHLARPQVSSSSPCRRLEPHISLGGPSPRRNGYRLPLVSHGGWRRYRLPAADPPTCGVPRATRHQPGDSEISDRRVHGPYSSMCKRVMLGGDMHGKRNYPAEGLACIRAPQAMRFWFLPRAEIVRSFDGCGLKPVLCSNSGSSDQSASWC